MKFDSLPPQKLLTAVCSPNRWRILAAIHSDGPMGVNDLSGFLKMNPSLVSKHLAVLRKAGILQAGRGRLNHIAKDLQPAPGSNEVDLGHFVIRLPSAAK
ncbi:MAG TPA: ArsR family transcriptional regulator [Chthoniobacteraceae bacterium]|nr:ArsR family transcriptional regulator [Chthoniobacteraceae bacterium]